MPLKFAVFILLFHSLAAFATTSFQSIEGLPKRALIIGNAAYSHLPKLDNPVNDARDMAKSLTDLGFSVETLHNGSLEEMEEAIELFGQQLAAGGVGLFYYAGHGVQVGGINFLIPANAELKKEKDLRYKAVNVGQLLDEMDEARNGLNIVILDACRDNPLKGFRSAGKGLAKVKAPKGTLVAFATSPDKGAADGEGQRNGIYTKHLLQQLKTPGLSVEQVFKKVLQGVDKETGGEQIPWVLSSFTKDFYFIAPRGDVKIIQSQQPIMIHEGSNPYLPVLWINTVIVLLLTTLAVFYFYRLRPLSPNIPSTKEPEHSQVQIPVIKQPLPDLDSLENAQAAGYLINLDTNQAIGAILPGQRLVLGRSKRRADVYLSNTAISAEHAAIHYHTGSHCFLLEDLHSSNNTWIKGQAPLAGRVKTAVQADQLFYLADKANGFYIFVPDE